MTVAFNECSVLLYGPSKIGKTSFANKISGSAFIATERGHNFLNPKPQFPVKYVSDWAEFLSATSDIVAQIKKGVPIKTVVIDRVDSLYPMVEDHVCKENKIKSLQDLEWGKGFSLARKEFERVIRKLSLVGIGIVYISLSKEKELKSKTQAYTVTTTTLDARATEIVAGLTDFNLFAYMNEAGQRVVRTKPYKYVVPLGDRTGLLPEIIPFQYEEFISEFNKAVGNKEEVKS